MINDKKQMNYYNTYISYGLNEAEKEYLNQLHERTKEDENVANDRAELYYVACDKFTDVLAIPAALVLIRFSALSEQEIAIFNECFEYSDSAIFAMDSCPENMDFVCYENINLLDRDGLDWAYMLRVLLMMEKRESMFSGKSIELSSQKAYCALDLHVEDGILWVDVMRVRNGKVQQKEFISTNHFEEAKEWIGGDAVAVWSRYEKYLEGNETKTLDKILFSNQLININILTGTEFPYLAPIITLKDRVAVVTGDDHLARSSCEMIAILLAYTIQHIAPLSPCFRSKIVI